MAGRKAKTKISPKKLNIKQLKPSDVLCPICRTILIEPVTLPCNHAFCKLCFDGTMENANLVCPLCRVRVGSWFRRTKKLGKLVDEALWTAVQKQYPREVQNKYKGIDNAIEEDKPVIVVATPGEIRKEYEQERQKELEERRKIRDAEEAASAALIRKIKEEEERQRQAENEKLRADAEFAKKLAQELKPSTTKVTPKKSGPLDRFIKSSNIKTNTPSITKNSEHTKKSKTAVSPNPSNNFATKPYTCQVINAIRNPSISKDPFSILSRKSYNYGPSIVQKKIKLPYKILEPEERKVVCKSVGSKSERSTSGDNSDIIDRECRFYFKPIDTPRTNRVPSKVPAKIPPRKGTTGQDFQVRPPSGNLAILGLENKTSAFVRFQVDLRHREEGSPMPSFELIENEVLFDSKESTPKNFKRKLIKDTKEKSEKIKRLRQMACSLSSSSDSPFYGFDNKITSIPDEPPFYGFNTFEADKAEILRGTLDKIIHNYLPNSKKAIKNNESPEEPLKLCVRRTSKNGLFKFRKDTESTKSSETKDKNNQIKKSVSESLELSSSTFKNDSNVDSDVHNNDCPNSLRKTSQNSKQEVQVPSESNLNKSIDQLTPKSTRSPRKTRNVSINIVDNSDKLQSWKLKESPKRKSCSNSKLSPKATKSPAKSKHSPKKLKMSPQKNVVDTQNSEQFLINIEERKLQEETDLALARKLQAEFDLIHMASTTRRGTKRQITLDEMLLV